MGDDASLSMEAARMPKGRETDAAVQADWKDFFDAAEDIKVLSRNATFRPALALLLYSPPCVRKISNCMFFWVTGRHFLMAI